MSNEYTKEKIARENLFKNIEEIVNYLMLDEVNFNELKI
ncbi:hypothetical protein CAXC1_200013 [Candidatus Xenohaliotis californiensis]|uniref:Uncharacterized protein n=1 Tax=Candidatus Xenohaliotis californiensis TaxID=84677 RepID=A0ABP0EVK8_9RICK|nr:hypothetical protein CAXC1_200013 [Candidatus Xenohaliotis californiensis]